MTYAVTWSEDGGLVFAGRLEVSSTCLDLIGAAPLARESHQRVLYDEVVATRIERRPESRVMGRTTLVVERRNAKPLRISTLSGGGMLAEVAERVSTARGQAVDAAQGDTATATSAS